MFLPQKNPKRLSKVYSLSIVVVVIIGLLSTVYVGVRIYDSSKSNLIDDVSTLAEVLKYENFSALSHSESDLKNPTYMHIKDVLVSVRSVNPDIRFIYLNGLNEEGTMFFYADSEDPSSEDYSPPGQLYPEATPPMFTVLDGKQRNS